VWFQFEPNEKARDFHPGLPANHYNNPFDRGQFA
jgi:hypothetical protein